MASAFIESIQDRLHKKDQNYIAYFCGPPGSGKSESSIELARLINPKIDQEHIVFSPENFFGLLNGGTLQKGDAIVYEEMGINAYRRDYFSTQNKAMVMFMEAGRALNLALIMNAPGLAYIDSGIIKLGHHYFETQHINHQSKICKCKVYDIQYNPKMDKIYWPAPRIEVAGITINVESYEFHKPSDELIIPYKAKKAEFLKKLNFDLGKKITESKKEKIIETFDVVRYAKEVLKNIDKFKKVYNQRALIDHRKIARVMNVNENRALKIKNMVEDELHTQT